MWIAFRYHEGMQEGMEFVTVFDSGRIPPLGEVSAITDIRLKHEGWRPERSSSPWHGTRQYSRNGMTLCLDDMGLCVIVAPREDRMTRNMTRNLIRILSDRGHGNMRRSIARLLHENVEPESFACPKDRTADRVAESILRMAEREADAITRRMYARDPGLRAHRDLAADRIRLRRMKLSPFAQDNEEWGRVFDVLDTCSEYVDVYFMWYDRGTRIAGILLATIVSIVTVITSILPENAAVRPLLLLLCLAMILVFTVYSWPRK